jgi:catechol 2,3-dioxygenase-like lactoylglutathione lyase family enzyme
MRLDHIAYRVADRQKTVRFFVDAFGYKIQTEFDIDFGEGQTAKCFALEPPEKPEGNWALLAHWTVGEALYYEHKDKMFSKVVNYHLAPEIFVSDGTPDSIVGKWVAQRNGIGGIHHLAYQVQNVQEKMNDWKEKGYAEFSTENPITCPGLTQVFTKPSELTGIIYEFIERGKNGFCGENVKQLMLSTAQSDFQESQVK